MVTLSLIPEPGQCQLGWSVPIGVKKGQSELIEPAGGCFTDDLLECRLVSWWLYCLDREYQSCKTR